MGFRFPNFTPLCRISISNLSSTKANALNHPLRPIRFSDYSDKNHFKIRTRGHTGHSHRHEGKEGENVFRLGLAADIALAVGKSVTGFLSGSTAIIADAAHSISDVVLSGVALWSFRVSRAPKDKEHPYGHGKFETLGALGISCMLLGSAGGIAWHAIDILQGLLTSTPDVINFSWSHEHGHNNHPHGIDMKHPVLALSMTIVSISVKEGLYWITKRVGDKDGSGLMKANAWHHRADAVSSVVTLIGVGGAIVGVRFLDPLAGLLVSGMILKAGIETGHQSVLELVDAAVPLHVLTPIKQTILLVEGVKGCHCLRGRRAGSSLYLDVHIEVDPFLSVSAAHDIGENVRCQIENSHSEVAEVFIHIDPAVLHCSPAISDLRKDLMEMQQQNPDTFPQKQDVEAIVSDVFSLKFSETIVIEHITWHSLQEKLLLQVEVSMPSDMLIRDAMASAKEAEKEILKAASSVSQVSIQLRLGHAIPQFKGKAEI